ncbi:MAG: hypothetical protein OXP07_05925 [Defluviicoccus sp.]|nr:hypothetical protein [Defluviicoccus sp.]
MHFRSFAPLCLVLAASAQAEAQTLRIKVAAAPPETATFVGTFKRNVVPAIDKRLEASGEGFRIRWTHAYEEELARSGDIFEAVAQGIGGAGLILKDLEPANLPLESYAVHMPFTDITRGQIAQVDAKLRGEHPELNQAYERHNQVFIASGVDDSVHLFARFPLTRATDLKNRKLASRGSFAQWLRGTGAVAVDAAVDRSRADLKKGLYQGYLIGIVPSYVHKTYTAARFFTRIDFGPTPASGLTFNGNAWQKIPAHARQIIREEAGRWSQYQTAVDLVKRSRFLGIMKRKGVAELTLSRSEREKWASLMPNIAREWADRLDRRGLPGTGLMTAYMDELRDRGIGIARHWDED